MDGPHGQRHLHPKAMAVLLVLAERPGALVETDEILRRVWGDGALQRESLHHCISEIRRALGEDLTNARHIQTLPRQGYRLVGPVTPLGPPAKIDATGPVGRSLLDELRRRKVFRVAAAYAVVAWLILQVGEVTFEPLRLPEWTLTLLVLLLVMGFPLAIVLAWIFEVTPAGLAREPTWTAPAIRQRHILQALAGAGLVALLGIGLYQLLPLSASGTSTSAAADTPAPNSIAVLPFTNVTGDPGNGYLSDGLAEQLLGLLGKIEELQVAARTASFYFEDKDIELHEIARRLRVRHILEGSVMVDGTRLRVQARLVDPGSGYQRWAETYDRQLEDVLAIQDDIARSVVQSLSAVLSVDSQSVLSRQPTDSVVAYHRYLRGRAWLRQPAVGTNLDDAVELFRRALEADPGYAQAYAGLCDAYLVRYELTRAPEQVALAEDACGRALKRDASLAEVHLALGNLLRTRGEYAGAESRYLRAVELEPNQAEARMGLGDVLAAQQRFDEAEQAYVRAIERQPGYWRTYGALGNFLLGRGRVAEATDAYRQVVNLIPEAPQGFNNLGAAQMMAGDFAAAAEAFDRSVELEPTQSAYSNSGTVHYYLGRYAEAVLRYSKALELADADFRLWGNAGDAMRLVPGREEEAREAYAQAVRLAREALEINDENSVARAHLAYYLSRLGRLEEAQRQYAIATERGGEDVVVAYYGALIMKGLGRESAALAEVERARKLGYPGVLLEAEPELKQLAARGDGSGK